MKTTTTTNNYNNRNRKLTAFFTSRLVFEQHTKKKRTHTAVRNEMRVFANWWRCGVRGIWEC